MIFAPTFASRFLSGVSHIWRPYREQQVTRRTVVNRGAAQVGKSLRLQKMNSVDRMIKEPAPVQDAEIIFDYRQAPGRSAGDMR